MPTYVALRTLTSGARIRVPAVTGTVAVPGTVTPTPSGSGGALAAGTYFYKVTALGDYGETTPATEVSSGVLSGATSSVALAWAAVPGATGYRVYVGTASNGQTGYFQVSTNSFTHTTQTGLTAKTVATANTATTKALTKVSETDTVVNVDDAAVRKALNAHRTIGQYVVTAVRNKLADGTTLPANS